MLTYEQAKAWISSNKDKIMLGGCFVLVFLVGFGTGRFDGALQNSKPKVISHYTTTAKQNPAPTAVVTPASTASTTPSGSCLIKGNISTGGKKIYHVPTGALYKVVKPEQCFSTEAEALAAGFVKSGR